MGATEGGFDVVSRSWASCSSMLSKSQVYGCQIKIFTQGYRPIIPPAPRWTILYHPPFIFVGQSFDPDRTSPALSPSCVSPGSFYAGVSPSPPRPPPASGDPSDIDDNVDASEDKENNRKLPLPDGGDTKPLREEADGSLATSKFFGGGSRSGGGKGPLGQRSGLHRRFRPPLAVARHSSAAPTASTLGEGGSGGGGGANFGRHHFNNGNPDPDPWGTQFAYPRLDVSLESPGNEAGCNGERNSSASMTASAGGSRLKRRRTLGVGSLVRSGMIRGLEGTAGIGLGCPGRRSKSLGGWLYLGIEAAA